ncbi:transcriptional regulator [Paenibacillus segetis]|uniref:Transcriptional regulator n=1 Tax=Paenibacillus segetis TaxID=1325360 RepID=A0ABQ1YBQ4_9BACL|nr:metalloregulator ArsR/SmtB family transcription factor [Paenibacillus segetis]GGH19977.1 transcriptional regulator [Paenibacillus segetis]
MRIINKQQQVEVIKEDFKYCQKVFLAIGNETRQSIITVLMETTCSKGLRVGEITEKTHLSRPAVSHHLKILRDAEIIMVREEGSKNYYFIDVRTKLGTLKILINHIDEFIEQYY